MIDQQDNENTIYTFGDGKQGGNPTGSLLKLGDDLYGTAYDGGSSKSFTAAYSRSPQVASTSSSTRSEPALITRVPTPPPAWFPWEVYSTAHPPLSAAPNTAMSCPIRKRARTRCNIHSAAAPMGTNHGRSCLRPTARSTAPRFTAVATEKYHAAQAIAARFSPLRRSRPTACAAHVPGLSDRLKGRVEGDKPRAGRRIRRPARAPGQAEYSIKPITVKRGCRLMPSCCSMREPITGDGSS